MGIMKIDDYIRLRRQHDKSVPADLLIKSKPPRAERGAGAFSASKERCRQRTPWVLALLNVERMPENIRVKATPGTPNKTENEYLNSVAVRHRIGEVADYGFAMFSVRVGVGTAWYTPDIIIRHNDGRIEIVEVKGYRWSNGISKVKMAAMLFPQWRFRIVKKDKSGWVYEELEVETSGITQRTGERP